MQLRRLVARGFRNLVDLDFEAPSRGMVLLGANAQGKTNLLEAIYYPVLFRSFRGAADQQAVRAAPGFHIEVHIRGGPAGVVSATYLGRKKRITVDGDEAGRLADVVGTWLAVAFLPADVGLASGPAAERRQYLDRVLSLSDRHYLRALTDIGPRWPSGTAPYARTGYMCPSLRHRAGRGGGRAGRWRLDWVAGAAEQFAAEFECLGEHGVARLRYRGNLEMADESAWAVVLVRSLARRPGPGHDHGRAAP